MKGTAEATGASTGKSKRRSTATSQGAGAAIGVWGFALASRNLRLPPRSAKRGKDLGLASLLSRALNRGSGAEKARRGSRVREAAVGCRCLVGPRVRGEGLGEGWWAGLNPVVQYSSCLVVGVFRIDDS